MSEKLKDSLSQFHDNGVYSPTRTLKLYGEIDLESQESFVTNFHALDQTTGIITILLSSEGGCVGAGLAIYDEIRASKNLVRIICQGEVASMATVILQAGDERIMRPNSYLMIHMGEQATSGHPISKKEWDRHTEIQDNICNMIYLKKIKEKKQRFSKNRLTKLIEHDKILTPDEAVSLGLADKIEGEV
jgi:ATP-dependent protease ClpP protease subunit